MNKISMSMQGMLRGHGGMMAMALWAAQAFLVVAFGVAGMMKATQGIDQLGMAMPWVLDLPVGLVRFIGIAELAGALGLVLPALMRLKPMLAPLAALGLMVIMVLAVVFHVSRGEYAYLGLPVFLGLLAAFVAWGRVFSEPIEPKHDGGA